MTTIEMNVALQRELAHIVADETLMERAVKALRRLRRERKAELADPTLMTKEEFLSRVEEADKGQIYRLEAGETLDDLINRVAG